MSIPSSRPVVGDCVGVFLTGTDTGVGKTVVTAAIAAAMKARGLRVGVMKPVESGCVRTDGALRGEDAAFLKAAAGTDDPLDLINPYALEHAIAPAIAAELEGVVISMDKIEAAYRALAGHYDLLLVEGAGGLLAPLYGEMTMRDMAKALDLRVMLIARNVLGVINHAALTVEAILAVGMSVSGIILNSPTGEADAAMASNPASLRRWVPAPLLGEFGYQSDLRHEALTKAAEAQLDMDGILDRVGYVPRLAYQRGGR